MQGQEATGIIAGVLVILMHSSRYAAEKDLIYAIHCPEEAGGNASKYFPVGGRCDQYWECIGGVPVLKNCSKGTLWNELSRVCDVSQKCDVAFNTSSDVITDSEYSNNEECSDVTCPWDAGNSKSTYFPSRNCDQFCECRNGVPILVRCQEGFLFNQAINICDWPQNVECNSENNNGNAFTTTSIVSSTTATEADDSNRGECDDDSSSSSSSDDDSDENYDECVCTCNDNLVGKKINQATLARSVVLKHVRH